MSFKITIVDNDNGQVIYKEDNAIAILGAVNNGESTCGMVNVKCSEGDIFCAVATTEEVLENVKKEHPNIEGALAMKALMKKMSEKMNKRKDEDDKHKDSEREKWMKKLLGED